MCAVRVVACPYTATGGDIDHGHRLMIFPTGAVLNECHGFPSQSCVSMSMQAAFETAHEGGYPPIYL